MQARGRFEPGSTNWNFGEPGSAKCSVSSRPYLQLPWNGEEPDWHVAFQHLVPWQTAIEPGLHKSRDVNKQESAERTGKQLRPGCSAQPLAAPAWNKLLIRVMALATSVAIASSSLPAEVYQQTGDYLFYLWNIILTWVTYATYDLLMINLQTS